MRRSIIAAASVGAAMLVAAPGLAATAPTRPVLRVAQGNVVWGDVAVGTASQTKTLMVGNGGAGTLPLGRVFVDGTNKSDFEVAASTCGSARLGPGQTCAVTLRFRPQERSTRVATLTVRTGYPDCTAYVPLAGTGSDTTGPDVEPAGYGFNVTCQSAPESSPPTTTSGGAGSGGSGGGSSSPPSSGGVQGSTQSGTPVCSSSRKIRIHVKAPRGRRFKRGSVRVTLAKRTVKAKRIASGRRAGQYTTVLDFSGLARKRYAVQLRGKLTSGRTYRRTRYFVTCTSGR